MNSSSYFVHIFQVVIPRQVLLKRAHFYNLQSSRRFYRKHGKEDGALQPPMDAACRRCFLPVSSPRSRTSASRLFSESATMSNDNHYHENECVNPGMHDPDQSFLMSSSASLSDEFERIIPKSDVEVENQARRLPPVISNSSSLSVAIIGAPNHGKSTLANSLLNWKVCSVSSKVHTTKDKQLALMVEKNVQIALHDTPGLITAKRAKKCKLDSNMVTVPRQVAKEVDLLLVLVDAANKLTQVTLPAEVIQLLQEYPDKESILVLNKVDKLKDKKKLLEMVRLLTNGIVDGQPIPVGRKRDRKKKIEKVKEKAFSKMRNLPTVIDDKEVAQENLNEGTEICKESDMLRGVSEYTEESLEAHRELVSKLEQKEMRYDLHKYEAETLDEDGLPVFMTLVDEDKKLPQLIPKQRGWSNFQQIFMVSALTGDGMTELRKYLVEKCVPSEWQYHPEQVTDKSPYQLALLTVREKFLDVLHTRLGYNLDLRVDYWKETAEGVLEILVSVAPEEEDTYLPLLIGPEGKMAKRISHEAERDLMNLFRCEVCLKLQIITRHQMGFYRGKTKNRRRPDFAQDIQQQAARSDMILLGTLSSRKVRKTY